MRTRLALPLTLVLVVAGCPDTSSSGMDAPSGELDAPMLDTSDPLDAPLADGSDAPGVADAPDDGGAPAALRVVASVGGPTAATGGSLVVIAAVTSAGWSCSSDGALCVAAAVTP